MTKLQEEYLLEILSENLRILEYGLWIDGIGGNGLHKQWYRNGQVRTYYLYKNGKRNGEYKIWYDNGQMYIHGFYKDKKLYGEYKYWRRNGKMWGHYLYKNGIEVGRKVIQ